MSILKLARWEFKGGPMENHWGFVGQSMGNVIDAIELAGGMGRYEKVGKGIEDCAISEDGKRVFYDMVHVSSERQSDGTAAPEPTPENELNGGCHAQLVRCSSFIRSRLRGILKKGMVAYPVLRPLGMLVSASAKDRSAASPELRMVSSEDLPYRVHECIFGAGGSSAASQGISLQDLETLKKDYAGEIPRNLLELQSMPRSRSKEPLEWRKLV